MKEIKLTKGYSCIVDDDDYDMLTKRKWQYHKGGYAARGNCENGVNKTLLMHVYIIGRIEGMEVDHINGNRLDNRRCNLRHATKNENQHNQLPTRKCKTASKYKGVTWHKYEKKWRARIQLNGEVYFLGYFDSEVDAAFAYNMSAVSLFGEFARLNVLF